MTPPDGHFRPPTPADGSMARPGPEWTLGVGERGTSGREGPGTPSCFGGTAPTETSRCWTFRSARPPAGLVRTAIVGRPPDSSWQPAAVADLDGDGGADVLWRHEASGSLEYWRMVGLHPVGTIPLGPANSDMDVTWRLVAVGDFNGDGADDLLWEQPIESAGTGFAVADEPTRRIKIWLSSRGRPRWWKAPSARGDSTSRAFPCRTVRSLVRAEDTARWNDERPRYPSARERIRATHHGLRGPDAGRRLCAQGQPGAAAPTGHPGFGGRPSDEPRSRPWTRARAGTRRAPPGAPRPAPIFLAEQLSA